MFPNEELQRLAGRICLFAVGVLGMLTYYFANVRFLPIMAGFAILAAVCYIRSVPQPTRSLRSSGQFRAH